MNTKESVVIKTLELEAADERNFRIEIASSTAAGLVRYRARLYELVAPEQLLGVPVVSSDKVGSLWLLLETIDGSGDAHQSHPGELAERRALAKVEELCTSVPQ